MYLDVLITIFDVKFFIGNYEGWGLAKHKPQDDATHQVGDIGRLVMQALCERDHHNQGLWGVPVGGCGGADRQHDRAGQWLPSPMQEAAQGELLLPSC